MDLLRSMPLGLYLEQPITWLHHLDARVKLGWLLAFLLTPVLANHWWRLGLVAFLIIITLSARIPLRVWKQQMGWLLGFSFLVFIVTAIAPDGLAVQHQPRLPSGEITKLEPTAPPERQPWYNPFGWGTATPPKASPAPPVAPGGYSYILFDQGPLKITRRSLDLGIRISTLLFTLIYSTNLYLLTTAAEEITAALEDLMSPLRRLKVPVTEITLTLTLSLRFIPLVLEETQNLIRSVRTRAINWKKLGWRGAVKIWMAVCERLLQNLLLRAEQIANSMQVRGFTSPNQHKVQWHQLRLNRWDWLALAGLVLLCASRLVWGADV
ncbi:energy-coupling factor transporter transmembrane protein EcfT [[Phormidium] sp. ETS-05]|uniref:energy-coupling factor transporter transmembrane component T family protein n=1 Tax=[Phormidium] sp. ETS-05 TaxID=222819 RepID=UPI0018EF1704|nr:CbiQ family ECF transporter T component [[Phormidium] sp. ETS-05]